MSDDVYELFCHGTDEIVDYVCGSSDVISTRAIKTKLVGTYVMGGL